jgi:hypothetical protein
MMRLSAINLRFDSKLIINLKQLLYIQLMPAQAEAIRQTGDPCNRTRLTPCMKKVPARFLAWRR